MICHVQNHSFPAPELLAPVGKEDVFHAVLEAGADAVYLAGKRFNMRRHRKDFNFSDNDLRRLCDTAHGLGKKVYITVNALVGERELPMLRDYLHFLADIGADSAIVQDLSVIRICEQDGIPIPLHASTMMNVNSAETALFLKSHGFTRTVTSRDITLAEAREIGRVSGLEMEYFIHGDMCSVQSGNCCMSGEIFGKSANRGQCMKPCRWAYDLVSADSGEKLASGAHVLAAKDLCLISHVPELIASGVASLKIEGRMKPAETLRRIVSAYREMIDEYINNPTGVQRDRDLNADIHRNRVRDISTGYAFRTPDDTFMDNSGDREPIFLSYAGKLNQIDLNQVAAEMKPTTEKPKSPCRISCIAGTHEAAIAALDNGCDNLILSWEGDLKINSAWQPDDIIGLHEQCRKSGTRMMVNTPKILTEKEFLQLKQFIDMFPEITGYVASSLGAIKILLEEGKTVWADYTLNTINSEAAQMLFDIGVERIMPSIEISFDGLKELIELRPKGQFDVMVHGPLIGMLVEHCLIAMHTQHISKSEFCQMPCAYDNYELIDARGNKRPLRTDKYCRNHIFLEHDLCMLGRIADLIDVGASSYRIDARLYTPEQTGFLVKLYREALNRAVSVKSAISSLSSHFKDATFTEGAYVRGIVRDDEISLAQLKREESHALHS